MTLHPNRKNGLELRSDPLMNAAGMMRYWMNFYAQCHRDDRLFMLGNFTAAYDLTPHEAHDILTGHHELSLNGESVVVGGGGDSAQRPWFAYIRDDIPLKEVAGPHYDANKELLETKLA